MTGRERLEAYLHENGVQFEEQKHALAYTAQQVAASEHIPGEQVAKAVVAFADANPVMLVLPAPHHVNLVKVAEMLGATEARLAREDEFAAMFPDCEVGATPAFGNLYGLPVYADRDLARDEIIVSRAGTHTDTISLRYEDWERLVKPTLGELCAPSGMEVVP